VTFFEYTIGDWASFLYNHKIIWNGVQSNGDDGMWPIN